MDVRNPDQDFEREDSDPDEVDQAKCFDEEEEFNEKMLADIVPTPPDGGYGWVIMFASLMCMMIVDGVAFNFGVFWNNEDFTEFFNSTSAELNFIGSVNTGCYLLMGPFVGALVNKFDCRAVMIAGGICTSLSFVLASFSQNLMTMIITYGIMAGCGFGLLYLPAIVCVSYYFEKRRALATGVTVCGSGLGIFIFGPLFNVLLTIYDWRNTIIIISAISLNGVVCGALVRPLKNPQQLRKEIQEAVEKKKKSIRNGEVRKMDEGLDAATEFEKLQRLQEAKDARIKDLQSLTGSTRSATSTVKSKADAHPPPFSDTTCDPIVMVHHTQEAEFDTFNDDALKDEPPPPHKLAEPQVAIGNGHLPNITQSNGNGGDHGDGRERSSPWIRDGGTQRTYTTSDSDTCESVTASADRSHRFRSRANTEKFLSPKSQTTRRRYRKHNEQLSRIFNSQIAVNGPGGGAEAAPRTRGHTTSSKAWKSQEKLSNIAQSITQIWQQMTSTDGDQAVHHLQPNDLARPLYRKDIFFTGSVYHLPQEDDGETAPDTVDLLGPTAPATSFEDGRGRRAEEPKTLVTSMIALGETSSVSEADGKRTTPLCRLIPKVVRDGFNQMFNLSLLKIPAFLIFCIANIFGMIGLYVPFLYIQKSAINLGVDVVDASILISILAGTNTGGRVVAGFLANDWVDPLLLNNLAFLFNFIIHALAPFVCTSFGMLAAYGALTGLCVAVYISLTSIILCEMFGLERLTSSFGLLTMARGIASVIGPPLVGMSYDATGSLSTPYFCAGACFFVSGLLHSLLQLPMFKKHDLPSQKPRHTPSNGSRRKQLAATSNGRETVDQQITTV